MLHDDFFDRYEFTPAQRQAIEVFYIRDLMQNVQDKAFQRSANEFYAAGLLRPPYRDCLIIVDLGLGISLLYHFAGGTRIVEYPHSRQAGFPESWPHRFVDLLDGEFALETEHNHNVAAVVLASLMTLFMKSMRRERVDISDALNRKRARHGRSKLMPYTVIRNPPPMHSGNGGTHASPTPHWRRGHVRQYTNGKAVIIEPTIVNAHVGEPVKRRAYIAEEAGRLQTAPRQEQGT